MTTRQVGLQLKTVPHWSKRGKQIRRTFRFKGFLKGIDFVNRVAKKLYCPVCPNTPLDVCTTQACKDWRAQIREQLASGWTDKEVMNYFVRQYGERVLAEPQRGGFTSLVWMLPVLVVLLGLIAVWLILKSWKASRKVFPATIQPVAPAATSVPRDILAKIEAEIRRMD